MQQREPYINPLEQHRANIGWTYSTMSQVAKSLGRTISRTSIRSIELGKAGKISAIVATTIAMTINYGYQKEVLTPIEVLNIYEQERERYLANNPTDSEE